MTPDKIKAIDEHFRQAAREFQERCNGRLHTGRTDRDEVRSLVEQVYQLADCSAPKIVFCQSPVQMSIMPILFFIKSRMSEMVGIDLLADTLPDAVIGWLRISEGEKVASDAAQVLAGEYSSGEDPGELLFDALFHILTSNLTDPAFQRALEYFDPKELAMHAAAHYRTSDRSRPQVLTAALQRYLSDMPLNQLLSPMPVAVVDRFLYTLSGSLGLQSLTLDYFIGGSMPHDQTANNFLVDYVNRRFSAGLSFNRESELLRRLIESAHIVYPFRKICFVCDNPIKLQVSEGRLHCADGPAVEYSDGFSLYFWENSIVPEHLIEDRASIDIAGIDRERNAELRRLMIEIYGPDRFINDSNAVPEHVDEYGTLYRRFDMGVEDLMMLKVVNKTLESDGSRKTYWLRVPPFVRTAREAVAWTFGMTEDEYSPNMES